MGRPCFSLSVAVILAGCFLRRRCWSLDPRAVLRLLCRPWRLLSSRAPRRRMWETQDKEPVLRVEGRKAADSDLPLPDLLGIGWHTVPFRVGSGRVVQGQGIRRVCCCSHRPVTGRKCGATRVGKRAWILVGEI
ncbi:hypothetical protein NDU88_011102 [Pleurodeles waltl]|uniref:Secreted protein n=1 Tax=Pleurodeles waltl TaxID=8319 RepID=A0AAV7QW93_PLEWA|nr:hypothetical protein NDU88_011102 [Pleurodeles waltl]